MQIAVRSYLTAGTVAVVGAGAIAFAPPVPSVNLAAMPAPVVADVTLTGLNLSLDQIITVMGKLGFGDVISPIVNLLPSNIVNNFVTEFSDQAVSLIRAAVRGVVGDLSSVITGLIIGPTSIINTFFDTVASVPAAVISAVKSLSNGELSATLQTLVAPFAGLAGLITEAVKTFTTKVGVRVGDLVKAVPDLVVSVVQSVVGNDFKTVVDMVKNAIAGLTKIFGGAGVSPAAAVTPVAAALAAEPAARTLTVTPFVAAEVPASVAVAPRGVSRADRAVARARAASATPTPAAAEAAPVETAVTAEVPASSRAEQATPAATSAPATSSRSKAAAHSRAAASRAAQASSAQ